MLQEISSDSVISISINRPKLIEELVHAGQELCSQHAEVKSIYLFGSLARDEQVGVSDADLLVVVEKRFRGDPLEATLEYLRYFNLPVGVDLIIMGEEQIKQRLAEHDPFISKVWQEKMLLVAID